MDEFIFYSIENDTIETTKSIINPELLLNECINNTKKSDALFTPCEVGRSIIKEYQKLEEKCINFNICDIYNIKIYNLFSNQPDMIMHLKLNSDYYPFVPPDIVLYPAIDPIYMYNMICHPDLDIRNTSKIRNIEFIIETVKKIIINYSSSCEYNHIISNNIILLLKNNNFRMKQMIISENVVKSSSNKNSGIGYGGTVNKTWNVEDYLNNLSRIKESNEPILASIINIMNQIPENNDIIKIHNLFGLNQFWIDLIEKYEINDEKYYSSIKNILIIINKIGLKINIPFLNEFQKMASTKSELIHKEISELIRTIIDVTPENKSTENEYISALKDKQSLTYEYVAKNKHYYIKEIKENVTFNFPNAAKYIMNQYRIIDSSLPLTNKSAIFFCRDTDNISAFKFLIIPNQDTPYRFGCFVFDVFLPKEFPNVPPIVNHATSYKHHYRFNPNLYADGKVCLSLLGTWSGQSQSEKWIPPNASGNGSTLLQLLLSIHSMIFSEDPWYNEPGRERGIAESNKNNISLNYNTEIRNATIQYAIINQLKYPEEGFEDIIKTHFKCKKDEINEYLVSIDKSAELDTFNKLIR